MSIRVAGALRTYFLALLTVGAVVSACSPKQSASVQSDANLGDDAADEDDDLLGVSLNYLTISPNEANTLCLTATPSTAALQPCSGNDNQLWLWDAGVLSSSDGRCLSAPSVAGQPNLNVVCDGSDASTLINWDRGQLTANQQGTTLSLDATMTPAAGTTPSFAAQQAGSTHQAWILQHNGFDFEGDGSLSVTGVQLVVASGGCLAAGGGVMGYDDCSSMNANQLWTMLPWGGIACDDQCLRWVGQGTGLAQCLATDANQAWTLSANGLLAPAHSSECLIPLLDPSLGQAANPPTLADCSTANALTLIIGQQPTDGVH